MFDVISGIAVEEIDLRTLDVMASKMSDSKSNCSRVIQPAHFVMDDNEQRTKSGAVMTIGRNAILSFGVSLN